MASRYVKDFEFPSAAGYTKSAPSKVTGQMFAKGGQAKAPKGIMVVIGVGKGKPVRKFKGGDMTDSERLAAMSAEASAEADAERIMRKPGHGAITDAERRAMRAAAAKKAKSSPYIPGTNIKPDAEYMKGLEEGARTPEYKKGGKVAKVMHEFGEGKLHSGSKKGPEVTNPKQAIAIALSEAGKSKKAKGGMAEHPDEAMDRKLIKSMVKPSVLKKAKGGACYAEGGMEKPLEIPSEDAMQKKAWADRVKVQREGGNKTKKPIFAQGGMAQKAQMAKSNAVAASLKGQKKTPYATGGEVMDRIAKETAGKNMPGQQIPADVMARYNAATSGTAPKSPLQRMGMAPAGLSLAKAKGVPVAPRAPMIASPAMGQRGVGVNAKRPGGPDVGKLRSMMAKAASQAKPENAPSMMKKGGKVK
jgi:hypothetical protein